MDTKSENGHPELTAAIEVNKKLIARLRVALKKLEKEEAEASVLLIRTSEIYANLKICPVISITEFREVQQLRISLIEVLGTKRIAMLGMTQGIEKVQALIERDKLEVKRLEKAKTIKLQVDNG